MRSACEHDKGVNSTHVGALIHSTYAVMSSASQASTLCGSESKDYRRRQDDNVAAPTDIRFRRAAVSQRAAGRPARIF